MPWTTAITDLRTHLSDGPTDRYSSKKRCFGDVNGTNVNFRTFEFRRITNFVTSAFPLGIYVDGGLVTVSTDYIETGDFQLMTAPLNGSVVEASYYTQWFLDSELTEFLNTASNWLTSGSDFTLLPGGLWPAALKYASAEAYTKMAIRWRTFLSEMYRVEDEPKKPGTGPADSYVKMATQFRKDATESRDEFYKRQGRSLQPLFGSVIGRVPNLPGGF